jgi:hypothetical protein
MPRFCFHSSALLSKKGSLKKLLLQWSSLLFIGTKLAESHWNHVNTKLRDMPSVLTYFPCSAMDQILIFYFPLQLQVNDRIAS